MILKKQAFDALSGELEYQRTCNDQYMNPSIGLGEHILIMEELLSRARRIWYSDSAPYAATMDMLRKVTATGMATGNKYEMPERK